MACQARVLAGVGLVLVFGCSRANDAFQADETGNVETTTGTASRTETGALTSSTTDGDTTLEPTAGVETMDPESESTKGDRDQGACGLEKCEPESDSDLGPCGEGLHCRAVRDEFDELQFVCVPPGDADEGDPCSHECDAEPAQQCGWGLACPRAWGEGPSRCAALCLDDADCGYGETCKGRDEDARVGVCGCSSIGETCGQDEVCVEGICDRRRCHEGCPDGWSCVMTAVGQAPVCVEEQPGQLGEFEACVPTPMPETDPDTCAEDFVCLFDPLLEKLGLDPACFELCDVAEDDPDCNCAHINGWPEDFGVCLPFETQE